MGNFKGKISFGWVKTRQVSQFLGTQVRRAQGCRRALTCVNVPSCDSALLLLELLLLTAKSSGGAAASPLLPTSACTSLSLLHARHVILRVQKSSPAVVCPTGRSGRQACLDRAAHCDEVRKLTPCFEQEGLERSSQKCFEASGTSFSSRAATRSRSCQS